MKVWERRVLGGPADCLLTGWTYGSEAKKSKTRWPQSSVCDFRPVRLDSTRLDSTRAAAAAGGGGERRCAALRRAGWLGGNRVSDSDRPGVFVSAADAFGALERRD
ncbi:hypothetical protein TEQG_05336 [Trichophyton equinum CBS 127.97]|uniref:Uncharacterized protein n=1 Tax=Trichophyton equinum (strain ATCC MYA-4606 / CBS 127.97) TaxID=559882 RepID=F2PWR5_TRIEC|nr:hypothetical protein TEQG_05336 [Trichophyton equinum CBS 127.97]